MVVFLHVSASQWSNVPVESNTWKVLNLYDSAVRSCVPIFFMISGMFLLQKDEITVSDLLKRILRFAGIYLLWAFLYAIDTLGRGALTSLGGIKEIIKSLMIEPKYHLWYLPSMMGIYLLLPALKAITEYKKGKFLPYFCLLFTLVILRSTVLMYPFETQHVPAFLSRVSYEMSGLSGYLLIGYYLSKKDFSKLRTLPLLAALLAVILVSTKLGEMYSLSIGAPSQILYGYIALPAFLEAIILFILFGKLSLTKLGRRSTRIISALSKATLTVYLLHPFFLGHIKQWFDVTILDYNVWLSVPFASISIFVVCAIAGVAFGAMTHFLKKRSKK